MLDILLFVSPGAVFPAVAAGVFGLLVGSFLNVVIHRFPKMQMRAWDNYSAEERGEPLPHVDQYNLVVPRSACPHCGHKITALENIPVLSYLALRGKCAGCKAPISVRYPLIELLAGGLSALLVWRFGSGWAGLSSLAFVYFLIAMTFIDADTQLLPDDMTLPLMWGGLLINLRETFVPLPEAVIGAVVGYLSLWTVFWLFKLIRNKEGMGYGDFKLLAALGAWLGWKSLPVIVLLSSAVGSIVGLGFMVFARYGRDHKFSFGPYLAVAGIIAMFYGKPISDFLYGVQ